MPHIYDVQSQHAVGSASSILAELCQLRHFGVWQTASETDTDGKNTVGANLTPTNIAVEANWLTDAGRQ